MKKICFVCLGNIVRSPVAEALFYQMVRDAGLLGKYQADSAGTGDWHIGEPPDQRMRRVAARRGLIYDHRAQQFQRRDFDYYDLILAMDRDNCDDLQSIARSADQRQKVHLLREFDPDGGPNAAVPDPYYGGIDGFEEVFLIIERSVRGLLETLEKDEQTVTG